MPCAPYWDADEQCLYFIDFLSTEYSVVRFEYKTGRITKAKIRDEISPSFIVKVANREDHFIVGLRHSVALIHWNGESSEAVLKGIIFTAEADPFYATNHLHYGTVASGNRIYLGSMRQLVCSANNSQPMGGLYTFTKKDGVHKILGNIKVGGGIGWNAAEDKLYFVDTCNNDVLQISNPADGVYCKSCANDSFIIVNFHDIPLIELYRWKGTIDPHRTGATVPRRFSWRIDNGYSWIYVCGLIQWIDSMPN